MASIKKMGQTTILLLSYLQKASFRIKKYSEVKDGEISFAEGSHEDLFKYSRTLRNMGFKNYVKNDSIYSDVKSHSVDNGEYKITFTTDSTLKRSNIKIEKI